MKDISVVHLCLRFLGGSLGGSNLLLHTKALSCFFHFILILDIFVHCFHKTFHLSAFFSLEVLNLHMGVERSTHQTMSGKTARVTGQDRWVGPNGVLVGVYPNW
jgi:hypothetical protein